MEDKLINKIINQHMKNFVNKSNVLKNKLFANDNKTNPTTASLSREISDAQLKKDKIINLVQLECNKPKNRNEAYMSRSSEKVEKKNIDNKSNEKFVRKNIDAATNKLKIIRITKKSKFMENKKNDVIDKTKNLKQTEKSIDSKNKSKEMNTNTNLKTDKIRFDKNNVNHLTNKSTSSCIVYHKSNIKMDRSVNKSVKVPKDGRNESIMRSHTVKLSNFNLI